MVQSQRILLHHYLSGPSIWATRGSGASPETEGRPKATKMHPYLFLFCFSLSLPFLYTCHFLSLLLLPLSHSHHPSLVDCLLLSANFPALLSPAIRCPLRCGDCSAGAEPEPGDRCEAPILQLRPDLAAWHQPHELPAHGERAGALWDHTQPASREPFPLLLFRPPQFITAPDDTVICGNSIQWIMGHICSPIPKITKNPWRGCLQDSGP